MKSRGIKSLYVFILTDQELLYYRETLFRKGSPSEVRAGGQGTAGNQEASTFSLHFPEEPRICVHPFSSFKIDLFIILTSMTPRSV